MHFKGISINTSSSVDSAQDRDYWRALVNAALNLGFHKPWSQYISEMLQNIRATEKLRHAFSKYWMHTTSIMQFKKETFFQVNIVAIHISIYPTSVTRHGNSFVYVHHSLYLQCLCHLIMWSSFIDTMDMLQFVHVKVDACKLCHKI